MPEYTNRIAAGPVVEKERGTANLFGAEPRAQTAEKPSQQLQKKEKPVKGEMLKEGGKRTMPVPVLEANTKGLTTSATRSQNPFNELLNNEEMVTVELPRVATNIVWKPLVEVADIDEVLGYKGNYAIYRLKQNNYLTLHMMQNYIELSDVVNIRDPDDFGNYTVDDLQALAECLYKRDKTTFTNHREEIKQMIIDRLISGRAEDDRVVVPTHSLYIECLVGAHPLLEDFKLAHRALDVKKVQAEVRHAELENIRLAARALEAQYEDPDVEKKIVIQGDTQAIVVPPDES